MLKAQLHIHTKEDPQDYRFVRYSAKELINRAAERGFDVLAITCHNRVVYNQELKDYAQKRNILHLLYHYYLAKTKNLKIKMLKKIHAH